ncbi:MAG: hypothetical protein NZM06_07635 [Chloroherpetonaceae bacterium]|nr:hypothetical protein [Chloroherpetonaceae bacterium]MDW8437550.1 hypothetical protein [Chloroherpetonaceae bacterium]
MLALAYSLFWANFVYGIVVKFGVFRSERFKILHHLIYFLAMLTLFMSAAYELFLRKFLSGMILLFVFLILLGMTRFSGRSSRHWQYAIFCNFVYTTVFIFLN